MLEYQSNYDANTSRTQDKLNEANETLESKREEILDLTQTSNSQQLMMQRFFDKRVHGSLMKSALRVWRKFVEF
jgi:hypothetical protein